uniref:Uncharacterized protein n=1 Tax=Rhodosorus marinus TaxID=101924 RepID=A0A7S2ZP48_9RHOD|mmetsp:Transcript_25912/g.102175  ORF Transcript_25912/g.102175 Transcript_25912/m.102175 type:complete len:346 (+) Transcript_25912:101-1138(+)
MSRGAATRENTRRALAEFDLIEPVHVWEKKRCQVHHVTVRKWMRSERRAERLPPPVFEEQVEEKKKEEEGEKEKVPPVDGVQPNQEGEVTPMETDVVVENVEHKTEEPESQRVAPTEAPEKPKDIAEAAHGMDLDKPVEHAAEKPLDALDAVQAEKASESVKSASLTPMAKPSAENATVAPIVSESKAPSGTEPDLLNTEEPVVGSDDKKPGEDATGSKLEPPESTPAEPGHGSSGKVQFEREQVGSDAEPMEIDDRKGLDVAGEGGKVYEDPAETIAGGTSAPPEHAPEAAQDPILGEPEAKEEAAETMEDSKPEALKGQAMDDRGSKTSQADGTESISQPQSS